VRILAKEAKLPQLIDRKIYKTGQTRGSDDDEIYQNRVSRSSTVLIPLAHFENCKVPSDGSSEYSSGFIALIPPSWYFSQKSPDQALKGMGLSLGTNCLVFFEDRNDWVKAENLISKWTPANSRTAPLGGQYIARISANTAINGGDKIQIGFTTTSKKGAGIRVYEYASPDTIKSCRIQLEAIMWLCRNATETLEEMGMTRNEVKERQTMSLEKADDAGLLKKNKLIELRILNKDGFACCPLCLDELSAAGFGTRLIQAAGREVADLTVTEISLFHIDELRVGSLGHRPYNLGWGHHHCNIVAKDTGIMPTLTWLQEIVDRNRSAGYSF
jgi:hypothetical protein